MGGNHENYNEFLDNICSISTDGTASFECGRNDADIITTTAEKSPRTESSSI